MCMCRASAPSELLPRTRGACVHHARPQATCSSARRDADRDEVAVPAPAQHLVTVLALVLLALERRAGCSGDTAEQERRQTEAAWIGAQRRRAHRRPGRTGSNDRTRLTAREAEQASGSGASGWRSGCGRRWRRIDRSGKAAWTLADKLPAPVSGMAGRRRCRSASLDDGRTFVGSAPRLRTAERGWQDHGGPMGGPWAGRSGPGSWRAATAAGLGLLPGRRTAPAPLIDTGLALACSTCRRPSDRWCWWRLFATVAAGAIRWWAPDQPPEAR